MLPRMFSVRSNLIMTWDSKTTFFRLVLQAERLVRRFGRRVIGLTGVSMHAFACIVSSFCPRSYPGLLILQGLVQGFACAMQFMVSTL